MISARKYKKERDSVLESRSFDWPENYLPNNAIIFFTAHAIKYAPRHIASTIPKIWNIKYYSPFMISL